MLCVLRTSAACGARSVFYVVSCTLSTMKYFKQQRYGVHYVPARMLSAAASCRAKSVAQAAFRVQRS